MKIPARILVAFAVLSLLLCSCAPARQKQSSQPDDSSSLPEAVSSPQYQVSLPDYLGEAYHSQEESPSLIEYLPPAQESSQQDPVSTEPESFAEPEPAQPLEPEASPAQTPTEYSLFNPGPETQPEAPAAVADIDTALFEQELLRLINAERQAQGVEQLGLQDAMRSAARVRAPEVLLSLSHTRPDASAYYTAFDEAGFVYAGKWHGENVSYMQFTAGMYDTASAAQAMYDELRGSPGHYNNMISENYGQVGIGAWAELQDGTVRIGSAQLFASIE